MEWGVETEKTTLNEDSHSIKMLSFLSRIFLLIPSVSVCCLSVFQLYISLIVEYFCFLHPFFFDEYKFIAVIQKWFIKSMRIAQNVIISFNIIIHATFELWFLWYFSFSPLPWLRNFTRSCVYRNHLTFLYLLMQKILFICTKFPVHSFTRSFSNNSLTLPSI